MSIEDLYKALVSVINDSSLSVVEKACASAYLFVTSYDDLSIQASHTTRWDRNLMAHEGCTQVLYNPEDFVLSIKRMCESLEIFICSYGNFFGEKQMPSSNPPQQVLLWQLINSILPLFYTTKIAAVRKYMLLLIHDALTCESFTIDPTTTRKVSQLRQHFVHSATFESTPGHDLNSDLHRVIDDVRQQVLGLCMTMRHGQKNKKGKKTKGSKKGTHRAYQDPVLGLNDMQQTLKEVEELRHRFSLKQHEFGELLKSCPRDLIGSSQKMFSLICAKYDDKDLTDFMIAPDRMALWLGNTSKMLLMLEKSMDKLKDDINQKKIELYLQNPKKFAFKSATRIAVEISIQLDYRVFKPDSYMIFPYFLPSDHQVWGSASIKPGKHLLDSILVHYLLTGEIKQKLSEINQDSLVWCFAFLAQQKSIEKAQSSIDQFVAHCKPLFLSKSLISLLCESEEAKQRVESLFHHPYFHIILNSMLIPMMKFDENTGKKIAKALIDSVVFVNKQSDLDELLHGLKAHSVKSKAWEIDQQCAVAIVKEKRFRCRSLEAWIMHLSDANVLISPSKVDSISLLTTMLARQTEPGVPLADFFYACLHSHLNKSVASEIKFGFPTTGFCTEDGSRSTKYLPACLRNFAIFAVQADEFTSDMCYNTYISTLAQIKFCLRHRTYQIYTTPFSKWVVNKLLAHAHGIGVEALESVSISKLDSPVKFYRFMQGVRHQFEGKQLSERDKKSLRHDDTLSHLEAMMLIFKVYIRKEEACDPYRIMFSDQLFDHLKRHNFEAICSLVVYSFILLHIHTQELESLKTEIEGQEGEDSDSSPWIMLKIIQMQQEWGGFSNTKVKPIDGDYLNLEDLNQAFDLPTKYAQSSQVVIDFKPLLKPRFLKPSDEIQVLRAERLANYLYFHATKKTLSLDDCMNLSYQLLDKCHSEEHCVKGYFADDEAARESARRSGKGQVFFMDNPEGGAVHPKGPAMSGP